MKYEVLKLLEGANGSVSGEYIAGVLGISRQAVSKNIASLRQQGHVISSKHSEGYVLEKLENALSPVKIKENLKDDFYKIEVKNSVSSTNDCLKEIARNGGSEGQVVVSASQTGGKGRLGRKFHSPKGGVYFSILLRPTIDMSHAVLITVASAVAVCRSIKKLTSLNPEIKWVNDVFCEGKKICGILSEASYELETRSMFIISGIGINVNTEEFPSEIEDIASSLKLCGAQIDVNLLVAEVLNEFWVIYKNLEGREFLEEYRKLSCVIGRNIVLSDAREGYAVDINDDANLVVEFPDGTRQTISSGEISVKLR